MLLQISEVLNAAQVAQARELLDSANWIDGRVTAGPQSARTKDNMQLPEDHPVARQIGETILAALGKNALFVSAALPLRVFPPLFNRYRGGQSFGTHIDNAIRQITGTPLRIRTDVSATLFFSSPHEYDGGELVRRGYLRRARANVKLSGKRGYGDLSIQQHLHYVTPVTRGERVFIFLLDSEHGEGRRKTALAAL